MPNPIKKSAIFLPCFIIIQSISICFSAEVKTIAVIDFDAQNTSKADANIISDFLRNALVKNECFKVVDKNNMDRILKEQMFQYSGCTNKECAVKIGKILNVQIMAIGLYSKFEEIRYITVNMVEVETGEIIVSEKMKFEKAKDVDKTVDQLAEKIAKDIYKEKRYDIAKLKKWRSMFHQEEKENCT